MRKTLAATALLLSGTTAHAQTSNTTTNCTGVGYSVQCNTTTTTEPNWNQIGANLGAAIAARRERKREEKAAQEAASEQAAIMAKINALYAADTATAEPPPTDERPILLACTIEGKEGSMALYEKHNRVDVTSNGVTKTRTAVFTQAAVTWDSALLHSSLSRVDGSFTAIPNIPEIADKARLEGTCVVASERKF